MGKLTKRKQILSNMKDMDTSEYASKSSSIVKLLLASEEYCKAETIGVTISRFPEVDTISIIEAAWKSGKKVAVPKCISSTREMDFRIITSFDDLETVYMDLREPVIERTETVEKTAIDLQIVPGVVYSDEGYRIGFGGGYYDRYLTDYPGERLSLAFKVQTALNVPVEEHDIPVNKIITENGVIQCRMLRERI
ncbi:5-formyltetrahydrofolate cyclo-ligase [Sporosarcina thermotolerans]|uniref:5-formyltetrahydrofolate cyclo-ligase n=1 Tax=Sporosarcina thermotolerans TaxID=633404 RepID=A0AAW9AAW9_9BACL|nr:5-formyltetrahydrofolate cyclo-ligase [Sporosarcina thermotolerans]MDW0117349.1 5-formyltetrahydrofolate cyclo-ligase [Sporosarcina thermotolerans]